MRAFLVPVQITEEERVIGGILSLRQLLYIITAISIGGFSFTLFFLPVIFRLFIFSLCIVAGCVLAFVPVYDMRADLFLFHYMRWRKSSKHQYLRGCGND